MLLSGKPVLVTGATGFIGSRLAELLSVQEGANVTGIGRNLDRIPRLNELDIEMRSVDLLHTDEVEKVVAGKEFIFNVAGVLDSDPEKARTVNVEATRKLAELAVEAGVKRIIHVSTVGVYDMSGPETVTEDMPLAYDHPATYPRTKARSERVLKDATQNSSTEVAVVRPSMVYGPGPGVWTVTMFKNIVKGDPVFLGDGSSHFNPVYIDDVAGLLIRCATSPKAAGEAFNASAEVTTWKNFMNHYSELSGKELKSLPVWFAKLMVIANKFPGIQTPVDEGFLEMATLSKRFSIEKARNLLKWEPETSLNEGMENTTRWLKEQGYAD